MTLGRELLNVGIMSFAHPRALSYAKCLKSFESVRLVGIADDDKERGSAAAERYGARYFASYDELLGSADAVVICAETAKRRDLALKAANANRHILCEAPFAVDIEGIKNVAAACRDARIILQPAFPVRFSPATGQAQEHVAAGKIGRMFAMKGTYRSKYFEGWFGRRSLSGGGAVMNSLPQAVDLMRWVAGSEPMEVYAEIESLATADDIDGSAVVSVKFSNGAFATIDPSWSLPKSYPIQEDASLVVIGSDGSVRLDIYGGQKMNVYCGKSDKHAWVSWGDNLDMLMLKSFIEAVLGNADPVVTGDDCAAAFAVVDAAYKSADRKEPVRL